MKNSKFTNPTFNKSRCFGRFLTIVALVSLAALPRTMGQVTERAPEQEQIATYREAMERANEAIRKQNETIRELNEEVAQLQAQIKASSVNNSNQLDGKWQRFDPKEFGDYPSPPYPEVAVRNHWSGTVRVAIVVGTNGMPGDVSVHSTSRFPVLDERTVDWVKSKWRFPEGAIRRYYWDCTYRLN